MNPDPIKILLAEDDVNLGFVIHDNLKQHGFLVDLCKDGEVALKNFTHKDYDICILDIMMPKMDGFTLASKIRAKNTQVPILFLTAKTLKEDRLQGFMLGGDDYITKPFSIEELLLRINVFVKRSNAAVKQLKTFFQIGKYSFDPGNLLLTNKKEEKKLTQMEADILSYLCHRKSEVVKRSEILKAIWGEDDYFNGRSLDVFISRLRKYLKDDENIKILNHHGVGFKLMF
ncbi:MAG: response regulator transcription factor [Cytophagales bacterium]|nr:response regulator transcription factor [Cytophagales bacterium]